jgi:transposase
VKQPPKLFLPQHVTPCYPCIFCQDIPRPAELPSLSIEKGSLGPGLLVHILVGKYSDPQLLNRLQEILGRHRREIFESTMSRGSSFMSPGCLSPL